MTLTDAAAPAFLPQTSFPDVGDPLVDDPVVDAELEVDGPAVDDDGVVVPVGSEVVEVPVVVGAGVPGIVREGKGLPAR